jgi:hypothetical protein
MVVRALGLNLLRVQSEPSVLGVRPLSRCRSFLTKEEVDGSSPSTVTTEASLLLGSFVFGIPDDNALDAHRTRFALRVWVQAPKCRAGRMIEVLSIALE